VWDAVERKMIHAHEKKFTLRSDGDLQNGDPNYHIQWWTGNKDAQGKEIYEGDYVEVADGRAEIMQVKWNPFVCGFVLDAPSGWENNWSDYLLTVVGNIFETK
jgi:hypothetical protein